VRAFDEQRMFKVRSWRNCILDFHCMLFETAKFKLQIQHGWNYSDLC
jgi:hypothetical protein